MHKVFLR